MSLQNDYKPSILIIDDVASNIQLLATALATVIPPGPAIS